MKFIVVNNVAGYNKGQVAKGLSKLLWNITRPDSVKDPNDVTKQLFGWVEGEGADAGEYALVVDELYEIKKHAQSDPDSLRPLLTHLTTQEKQELKAKFDATNRIPFNQIMNYFGTVKDNFEH